MDKNKLRVALGGKDNHAKDKEYFWRCFFMLLGITGLLIALLIFCISCGGTSGNKSEKINMVLIKYLVTGQVLCDCEKPVISILYTNESGGYTTIEEFIPPWEYEFECKIGQHVECMATYYGENEIELRVRLYQDNEIIDDMYSKGKIGLVSYVNRCIE